MIINNMLSYRESFCRMRMTFHISILLDVRAHSTEFMRPHRHDTLAIWCDHTPTP